MGSIGAWLLGNCTLGHRAVGEFVLVLVFGVFDEVGEGVFGEGVWVVVQVEGFAVFEGVDVGVPCDSIFEDG